MNGYELEKAFWPYAFEEPRIKAPHVAIYHWIVHRANKSGWKKVVDIQTELSMETLGITDWRTYKNALQFLHDCGLIVWVEKSRNQYTCNKVSLTGKWLSETDSYKLASAQNVEADVKAIVEAIVEAHPRATVEAIAEALQSYINPETNKPKTLNQKPQTELQSNALPDYEISFEVFWNLYDKKVDRKKALVAWKNLSQIKRDAAVAHVPRYVASTPDKKHRKNPSTYLHGECWSDEIIPISSYSSQVPIMNAVPGFNIQKSVKEQQKKVYK
ncbi:hypothetical protein [Pontibacter sp. SGAir0037]|uniref:hypothetical protein n=1 Tax=Pontibacter sp. SGAir0037 TaxID=2571030 RepID=UPI0010CD3141|nr:hypothetical protein [Pontibacter sp. SGAir0037]QCR24748.1 hypothetical protein C1N53_21920 [Pontibacter sp. SGAir0037]